MIYYLAIVFILNIDIEPTIIASFASKEACMIEADKQNRNNVIVRDHDLRAKGVEFACLKVERVYT